MIGWITKLTKLLPFLGPLIDKLTGGDRAAEIKAQKELLEAQAFHAGRISPKYLIQYVLVGLFALTGFMLILGHFFWPEETEGFLENIGHLIEMGVSLLP